MFHFFVCRYSTKGCPQKQLILLPGFYNTLQAFGAPRWVWWLSYIIYFYSIYISLFLLSIWSINYFENTNITVWEECIFILQVEACAHPFFDELREPNARLPNGRPFPPLFNFKQEVSLLFCLSYYLSSKTLTPLVWRPWINQRSH